MDYLFSSAVPTSLWCDDLRVTAKEHWAPKLQVIDNVSVLIDPGDLVLVLGSPKEINTIVLKELVNPRYYSTGDIHYSNLVSKGQLVYCSVQDLHYPYLTVRDTVEFALRCKLPKLGSKKMESLIHDLLQTVGLLHTLGTRVGDDVIRGISGGERRRLSILETLIAGGSITCFDNATRGLDSATAAKVINLLRSVANTHNVAFVTTLYQGSQEVYDKFDKALILFNGKQIYYGPTKKVEEYFGKLGYHKSTARQTTMEFVDMILDCEVTLEDKGIADNESVPHTSDQLLQVWLQSPEREELFTQIKQEEVDTQPMTSKYSTSLFHQFRACFSRNMKNNIRSYPYFVAQLLEVIINAICVGTLFLELKMTTLGSFARGSAIFFATMLFAFISMTETKRNFGNSLIISRQSHHFSYYRPSLESLSDIVAGIPFKFMEVAAFLIPYYFLVGMNRSGGGFFSFLLFMFISVEGTGELYHMIARLATSMNIVSAVSGLAFLWLAMYASYVIQADEIQKWSKYWLMYTDPVMYAFESLITTQLHGKKMDCTQIIPSGNKFYDSIPYMQRICAWYGASLGNNYVWGDEYLQSAFGYEYSHVWRNLGILVAFFVGFTAIEVFGIEWTVKDQIEIPKMVKEGNYIDAVDERSTGKGSKEMVEEEKTESSEGSLAAKCADQMNQSFAWHDVEYTLPQGQCLLHGISGYICQGEVSALMGASGAGKTTLLNVLASRYSNGKVKSKGITPLPRIVGYVEQQEMFVEELNVEESLKTHSNLIGRNETNFDELLELLGLTRYKNYKLKDLSLEHRKKVSLGVELVGHPSILFIDEITSGLDDLSAFNIIRCLRKLAREANIAILCTVHQPSPTLVDQFDRLLLLKKGGYETYFGRIEEAIEFFSHHPLRERRPHENIADYIIELTSDDSQDWPERWSKSPEAHDVEELLNEQFSQVRQFGTASDDEEGAPLEHTYGSQFGVILSRTFIEVMRNRFYLWTKLALSIVSGLFIGFSFYKVDYSLKAMQSTMFAIFMILATCLPVFAQIHERCNPAKILYELREFRQYHWSILPLCQCIIECPLAIFCSSIGFCCFYFAMDVNSDRYRAGLFYLNYCIVFQLWYVTFGIGTLYVSPDLIMADILACFLFGIVILFCGAMQPYSLIPAFWKYTVYYETPFTYFLQNLMSILFHGRKVVCSPTESALLLPQYGMTCGEYMKDYIAMKGGYLASDTVSVYCTYCQYKSGDEFTESLNMKFSNIWRNFGIMWAFIVVNVVLLLVAYKYVLRIRKVR